MRDSTRDIPLPAIKEELGGDYYYRCPYASCNKIVKSEWVACPYCGALLDFKTDYNDNERRR